MVIASSTLKFIQKKIKLFKLLTTSMKLQKDISRDLNLVKKAILTFGWGLEVSTKMSK